MVVNGSWTALFVFQAAAQCYIDLIIKESDNNVKLIVLDRLIELKEHPTHERVLQVSVVKNIDISINIDTEISERYQY